MPPRTPDQLIDDIVMAGFIAVATVLVLRHFAAQARRRAVAADPQVHPDRENAATGSTEGAISP